MSNPLLTPGLPHVGWTFGKKVNWLYEYEKKMYEESGNPNYTEFDVEYDLNSLGYRCPAFDTPHRRSVLLVGDSYSFGYALPMKETFGEIVRAHVEERTGEKTVLWNLSYPGMSNDYICRTVHQAVPFLKPDLTIVNFTTLCRREYVAANGEVLHYMPHEGPNWSIPLKECWNHIQALTSEPQDELNFFLSYKSISSLLKGSPWIAAGIDIFFFGNTQSIFEADTFAGFMADPGRAADSARDNLHLGARANRWFADRLLAFIEDRAVIAKFKHAR